MSEKQSGGLTTAEDAIGVDDTDLSKTNTFKYLGSMVPHEGIHTSEVNAL